MKLKNLDKIFTGLAVILLVAHLGLQLHLASRDSQTTDEGVHLLAGYTYLTKHDYRFNPEHPILVKELSAIPLLFMKVNLPSDFDRMWNGSSDFFYDNWRENRILGEVFLYQSGNDPQQLLFWGRFPIVLLTILLGVLILLFAKSRFSAKGALLATALYVLNPVIIAHGHLITTDIAVSLGCFLTIILFLKYFKEQTWKNLLLLSLAFTFSQLVKFTAVILLPLGLLLFAYSSFSDIVKRGSRLKMFVMLIFATLFSWLIIWACYGFDTTQIPRVDSISGVMIEKNAPDKPIEINTSEQGGFDKVMSAISPILIPRDYFKGLFMVLTHVESGHDSYLLGKFSNKGWWYYFPVVFIAKNPIPSLLIFAMAIYCVFSFRKNKRENIFILLGAMGFLVAAMTSKANLGVRHILPIFPLLMLLSANTTNLKTLLSRAIVIILALWLIFEAIVNFPFYLSYFNQIFGGRENGYKVASDSNLDWGRDVKDISRYLSTHDLSPAYIEYGWNGPSSLTYYDVNLQDASSVTRDTIGYLIIGGSAVDSQRFAWLDYLPIYDRITPSVFVYKLNGSADE